MNNTVSAQARIRWAKNLVEFMYFCIWVITGCSIFVLMMFCIFYGSSFFVLKSQIVDHTVNALGKDCVEILLQFPGLIIDLYMVKSARCFLMDMRADRLFSIERRVFVYRYAVLWVCSFIFSFLHGMALSIWHVYQGNKVLNVNLSVGIDGNIISFVQQAVFLLVILLLYDAGVQLQKDMDEVI